jgi:hypothetical protein
MLYFVRRNQLHRFPVPKRCGIRHEQEPLRDNIPDDVEQCVYCMHVWPGEKDNIVE